MNRAYSISLSVTVRYQKTHTIKPIDNANGHKPSVIDGIGNRIDKKVRSNNTIVE